MKRRIALLHEKIKNRRQDDLIQIKSKLANDKQVVTYFVENLNIKGMASNRCLAKAVLDRSCDSCGLEIDRDLNAGINIRRIGLNEVVRWGTFDVTTSVGIVRSGD